MLPNFWHPPCFIDSRLAQIGPLWMRFAMNISLFKFYAVFMLVSLCLFSFEDKSLNQRKPESQRVEESSGIKEAKESKEEKSIKKPFKHAFRSSNLC